MKLFHKILFFFIWWLPLIVCYGTLHCVLSHFVVTTNPTRLIWFTGIIYSIAIPGNGFLTRILWIIFLQLEGQPLFLCPGCQVMSAEKQFIAESCDWRHWRWHLLQVFSWILQDRGRFQISPIFQMKLNFWNLPDLKSRGRPPKDVGRYQGQWI